MDIDAITKVETLGGILARISKCDPQVQEWADRMNGRSPNGGADGLAVGGQVTVEDPNAGGADGAAGGGRNPQVNSIDVMEIYSPPRVTVQASKHGLRAGEALDLITGFDFNKKEDRDRAWEIVKRDEPMLVVGSPECKMFSSLQNMSKWTNEKQSKL